MSFGTENSRRVGLDQIGEYVVSTVRLSCDHGVFDGVPLWYETMIFKGTNCEVTDWEDLYCDRYPTRKDAEQGHLKIIEAVRAGKLPVLEGEG